MSCRSMGDDHNTARMQSTHEVAGREMLLHAAITCQSSSLWMADQILLDDGQFPVP